MRELNTKSKPIAIALGYFDCVHYAHRKIIAQVVNYSRKRQIKSAVFTFNNELITKSGRSIYSFKERKRLIGELEVDYIVPFCFDDELKSTQPQAFLDLLFKKYDIRYVCCGNDYTFGCNGKGNAQLLKEYAENLGIAVEIFSAISMNDEVVSTSLIKNELADGNIEKANKFLCSPYFIEGKVSIGKGRGQGLGFPTANLKPVEKFLPKFGVYKSRTYIDGKVFLSITSIGNKPTFDDDTVTVETHVEGSLFNLYSKNIRVELIEYLRELKKFTSIAQLKEQIKKDISTL